MKRRQRTHVMLDGERTTICGRTRVDAVLAMNGEDVTCTVCVQGLGYERVKKERDEARAEVAALREEVTRAVTAQMTDRALNRKLRHENERARALLARWIAPYEDSSGPLTDETRAFLDPRRDDARACSHRWIKERGVNVEWCQDCGAQQTPCTCGLDKAPGLVEHTPDCGTARDEARRCTCAVGWYAQGSPPLPPGTPHDPRCPACDEAPSHSFSTDESKPPRR